MKQASAIDYQAVLRDISQSMVRLKRPDRLLRMITRYLDREMNISHTGIMVFKEDRKHYSFVDSKGTGRIPASLVKFETDHPLVRWFVHPAPKKSLLKADYLSESVLKKNLKAHAAALNEDLKAEADEILRVLKSLHLKLVVPAYFKKSLLGLVLIGERRDKRPFSHKDIVFFQIMTQDCSMAIKAAEYHRSLVEKKQELEHQLSQVKHLRDKEQKTYYEIMRSLASEVYAKDAYTFGHIGQVERLGLITAREMGLDLSGRKKDILSAGLILHDVGKIGIPDRILNKPSQLTPDEWEIMRTHVDKGAKILEPLTDFKEVREVIRCHHENFDGSGYPRGLKGDQIPVESRIVAVVDAFHAIVSTRCYSSGRPIETAFKELRRCAGSQFDPEVVEAFIKAMTREMKKRGIDPLQPAEDIVLTEEEAAEKE
ncbi:MAG TPA: HD-GYP domain-containing protein [Verrucomicrobiae bacterium]|jgi:HD-GYP domain-containing protein (c-di-GMP phosphodiesterase class II)|nr:HD-GYP domain-containing protein [Verrucomicrobiae bacterium]